MFFSENTTFSNHMLMQIMSDEQNSQKISVDFTDAGNH